MPKTKGRNEMENKGMEGRGERTELEAVPNVESELQNYIRRLERQNDRLCDVAGRLTQVVISLSSSPIVTNEVGMNEPSPEGGLGRLRGCSNLIDDNLDSLCRGMESLESLVG